MCIRDRFNWRPATLKGAVAPIRPCPKGMAMRTSISSWLSSARSPVPGTPPGSSAGRSPLAGGQSY
eukprot:1520312-Alexandrium_andersonii.AAC.1